ncbi:MAG: lysophospholipid acyltransferase family protein [Pseudomonadota bacterium]
MIKLLRFSHLLLHLFKGFFVFGFAINNDEIIKQGISARKRERLQGWLKKLLAIYRVKIVFHGKQVESPKMIVCNHISWMDVVILSSLYPGHFIAKSEIRSWPVMGPMISSIGTLFIKRGVRSEMKKMSQQVGQILDNKSSVVYFPEGKTGDGKQINTVYSGLFESAITAGMDVQPMLVIYSDSSGYPSQVMPYLTGQSLFASIMAVLEEKQITAHLFALDSISSKQLSRKEIGAQVEQVLSLQLAKEIA